MASTSAAIAWLCDSDPAIAWQTRRDILGQDEREWHPVQDQVETTGWGARLLAQRGADGLWAGGAFLPSGFTRELWEAEGQPWTATSYALTDLREYGLNPATRVGGDIVRRVGANARWDHDDEPFWEGEAEECINGRTVADGAYFGADVSGIVERLLGQRQPDGGWNCERAKGSTRSSFHSTINVLEGLMQYAAHEGDTAQLRQARRSGEEFLLQRNLFRRLSTGKPASEEILKITHPSRWHYDVLRGLDYFRAAGRYAGTRPDARLAPALDWLRSRRLPDGRWSVDVRPRGRAWFHADDGEGMPSRWATLRALRVLTWAEESPAI
ncbi:MAG: squalene cyclase [Actinobacteria bacterium]|nr:squalene cyclase [Actinomycetota bacterium]